MPAAKACDSVSLTENGRTIECTPQQLALAEIVSERVVRKMLAQHMLVSCEHGDRISVLEKITASQSGTLRIVMLLLVSNLAGAGVVTAIYQLFGS